MKNPPDRKTTKEPTSWTAKNPQTPRNRNYKGETITVFGENFRVWGFFDGAKDNQIGGGGSGKSTGTGQNLFHLSKEISKVLGGVAQNSEKRGIKGDKSDKKVNW